MTHQPGLHDLLADAARDHGQRVAIVEDDRTWSFEAIATQTARLAAQLDREGVRRGERVAVLMSNRVELPVTVLALARLGAVAVLLSPAWRGRELDHALTLTGARRVLIDDRGALDPDVDELLQRPGLTTTLVECTPGAPAAGAGADPAPGPALGRTVDPDGDAVLVFSSGTTGLPKAVRHTHATLGAATRHWVAALGLGADDRFQVSTPPSHILGLLNLLAAFRAGAMVRLHRRFDLEVELRAIESDRMTLEMAVAPIMLAMANRPELEQVDLSSLRFIMWGATPVTGSVATTVTRRTGVPVLAAYGASEVPVLAVNPVEDPAAWRLDSPGVPPAGVELRVVDPETGAVLAAGEIGELEARSPSTMAGYLPASAGADAFHDGWYRTGDVGTVEPDGWVRLTDRWKDMIKVNGFQVAPAEIEAVLLGHPAVLDCAVFGVPHDRSGEAPVAAVQLDPTAMLEPGELESLVDGTLAHYKRLHGVVPVDSIPRLGSGKALRRQLRARWIDQDSAHQNSTNQDRTEQEERP
jgi:long-chain acyl-CoA synthetase